MMIKNISSSEELSEELKHVSLDLKAIREAGGIALNDVSQITRINPFYIEAIENEDFHLLPPPVYTKAFIKNYARIINIDSKKVLDRYERYLEIAEASDNKEELLKSSGIIKGHSKKLFLSLLTIAMAGIVIVPIYLSYNNKSGLEAPYSQVVTTISPTADVKPVDAAKRQEGSGNDIQANAEKSNHLSIEATELTWLRIREGQNSPYEILLRAGEKIERIAPFFVIDVGNAGGIKVDFQGTPMARLGESGQVVHLRFP
ncbi:MAG: RodZ domain-containing protein [Syntrophales bacterium]